MSKLKSLMMRPSQVINMKLIKMCWRVFWAVPFIIAITFAAICVGIGMGAKEMSGFMEDYVEVAKLIKSKGE